MPRMVLSTVPDHPFGSRLRLTSMQNSNSREGACEAAGISVRGHSQRAERMQHPGLGRRLQQVFSYRFFALASIAMAFMLVLSASAHAQSAGTWNKRGEKAEARNDYDAAFEAFRQAHLKKPSDLRYKTRYERLRFEAANMHLDRGRVLKQSGDMAGAMAEFERALQIDPGNEAAAQELQLAQKAAPPPTGATNAAPPGPGTPGAVISPATGEEMPHQEQVQRDINSLASPVTLKPVSNDPITLHMMEDTKVIYQAIGKAAGLNVIFDPDYTSKRIPVDLTNVSLFDALRIVGTLSDTFWKPVTPNTIFVAQNNPTKRTDLGDQAVQTFYLTNVSQQNDANEILVALRNLLDPSVKIYLVASQNAIVMRASPDELVLAEKIINDLDRVRSEVIIDVAVLEVSRQKERDLGITLPTSFGLTPQYSNANQSSNGSTSTNGTTTSSTTTTSSLTLNTLGNLNATNFAVSLSGAQVNALLTDSDTRILQNPRIRATDGQKASLMIGSKIPVATGSYSSTLSATASLGVQTQFQYLNVGVNLEITPTVHLDHEVSLKMKVEISSQNGSETISGVTEPIIAQRVAEQTIQLKDGEPSMLAGLFQQQDSKNVNGTPGLGEIPLLKYFFSSQDRTTQKDEIVFLLIPHIVRESILTDENTRPVYTGTSRSIELIRRDPSEVLAETAAAQHAAAINTTSYDQRTTTSSNAAQAMVGRLASENHPLAPNSVPPSSAARAAAAMANAPNTTATAPVTLSVVPPVATQTVGSTFQVAVMAANAHDLYSVPMQLQFNPKVLQLVNVDDGNLLGRDGQAVALVHRDEGDGAVTISASRPPNVRGVDGQGALVTLTFRAMAPGDSALSLVRIGARDSRGNNLPTVGTQGMVHVK